MKVAITSDIHSNLTALNAVAVDMVSQKVDIIYCLGDIVGYGPYPVECWEIVEKICSIIIKGNHESCVTDYLQALDLNRYAQEGVRFSRKKCSEEILAKLDKLPLKVEVPDLDMVLCHGAFTEPSDWTYVLDEEDAENQLKFTSKRICVVGHTHSPFVYGSISKLHATVPDNLLLKKEEKYIINVGSVGQPRDGDCRSAYGIFETKVNPETNETEMFYSMRRVFYNIQETANAMIEAGISKCLSERLYEGE